MCSFVLKEALEYYNSNRATVYCVMLDASKAFDRVQYCKLFRKLLSRQMPAVIVRFLPARRYARAGYRDRNVSVCLSVCHAPVLCQNEES